MTLTKDDLKQIRTVVKEETYNIVKVEISGAEKRLGKKIENEVGTLAIMVKKEFDAVGERFKAMDQRFDRLEKGQKQIRAGISHLEFIATEMVRRDELIEVKQRLSKIETKLGILK